MIRRTLLAVSLVCAVCAGLAQAETLSHDNGDIGTQYSGAWGDYFANDFTNDIGFPASLVAVLIRKTPSASAGDVYIWEDDNGSPGDILAGPVFDWREDPWERIDVSSFNIVLSPGEHVFAGFAPRPGAQVYYDTEEPGDGESYWVPDGPTDWVQGGRLEEDGNLMLRLEVLNLAPEPASMSLLAMAGLGLIAKRRRR